MSYTLFHRATTLHRQYKKKYTKHLINQFYHRIPHRHEHKIEPGSRIHFLYSIIPLCSTDEAPRILVDYIPANKQSL